MVRLYCELKGGQVDFLVGFDRVLEPLRYYIWRGIPRLTVPEIATRKEFRFSSVE